MKLSSLLHTTLIFWIILDPFANIPFFLSVLKHFDSKTQRRIILREMFIALGVMILFLFFGRGFFHILKISQPALQIMGGIILFLISMQMIFTPPAAKKHSSLPEEPMIVPLAVPAVAGPAILATISLYGGGGFNNGVLVILAAIILSWLLLLPTLLLASNLKKILGQRGIIAIERLFGYLVVVIAAQMALSGITSAMKTL